VLDTHSKYRLSKTDPALQLLSVGDLEKKTFGLHLAAMGLQPEISALGDWSPPPGRPPGREGPP